MVFCAALELRRASGVLSAGAGGNKPGIPACRPGSGFSKSDYRTAEAARSHPRGNSSPRGALLQKSPGL